MQVRFTWRSEEWREAYLLSQDGPPQPSSSLNFNYILLGLLALGGSGDIVHAILADGNGRMQGTVLPMLLLLAVSVAAFYGCARLLRRRMLLRGLPTLPAGEQRVTIQEAGWTVTVEGNAFDPMQPWSGVRGHRVGRTVIALSTTDGRTLGVPLRALTSDQGSWIHRLLSRKVAQLATA